VRIKRWYCKAALKNWETGDPLPEGVGRLSQKMFGATRAQPAASLR